MIMKKPTIAIVSYWLNKILRLSHWTCLSDWYNSDVYWSVMVRYYEDN